MHLHRKSILTQQAVYVKKYHLSNPYGFCNQEPHGIHAGPIMIRMGLHLSLSWVACESRMSYKLTSNVSYPSYYLKVKTYFKTSTFIQQQELRYMVVETRIMTPFRYAFDICLPLTVLSSLSHSFIVLPIVPIPQWYIPVIYNTQLQANTFNIYAAYYISISSLLHIPILRHKATKNTTLTSCTSSSITNVIPNWMLSS